VFGGDCRNYIKPSLLFDMGYSYRFMKNLQADASLIFGSIETGKSYTPPNHNDNVSIGVGGSLPQFGGRAILPLARGRFEFFGGTGAIYMH
jgi:hypothetical protein